MVVKVRFEDLHQLGRKGDHPSAGLRFRGAEYDLSARELDCCFLNGDRSVEQVDPPAA